MNRRGFTLAEVMVSIAVGGLVVLLVHAGLGTTVELITRAADAREAGAHAAAIRRQIATWLSGAVVEGSVDSLDFKGVGGVTAEGHPDAVVTFLTLAPGPFERGRVRLTLVVDHDPATPATGLVAYQGGAAPPADASVMLSPLPPVGHSAEVVLVPQAAGLVIRYLHRVDGEYVWSDAWRSSARLPEAVELRLIGDSVPPLLQAPLFIVPGGVR